MKKRAITKCKAARRPDWDDNYRYRKPAVVFNRKSRVPTGTFMMNPKLNRIGLGYKDDSVWDDVPLNMQLRTLCKDGTTMLDKGRLIENDEPFFATGEAFVSSDGGIVLVQVIPADGYPGWVELTAIGPKWDPGSVGDAANDTVKAWFCQRFDTEVKKKSSRRG